MMKLGYEILGRSARILDKAQTISGGRYSEQLIETSIDL